MASDTHHGGAVARGTRELQTMKPNLKLVLGVVALIALAGCLGAITGDDGASEDDPVNYVPDEANMLVSVDMALIEDPATQDVLDAAAEEDPEAEDADEALEEIEDELGLDPLALDKAVMFSIPIEDADPMEPQEHVGLAVAADWDEDEFVDAVAEEEDYEFDVDESAPEGVTVYEPDVDEEEMFGEPVYIAALDDGQYVVGDEDAVLAAADVGAGDAPAVEGELRDAYDEMADGLVTFAFDVQEDDVPEQGTEEFDPSAFEDVSVVAGQYATTDDTVKLEAFLYTDSEETAQDVADMTDGALALFANAEEDEEVVDEIRSIAVEKDGTDVVITYEADTDSIIELMEEASDPATV